MFECIISVPVQHLSVGSFIGSSSHSQVKGLQRGKSAISSKYELTNVLYLIIVTIDKNVNIFFKMSILSILSELFHVTAQFVYQLFAYEN